MLSKERTRVRPGFATFTKGINTVFFTTDLQKSTTRFEEPLVVKRGGMIPRRPHISGFICQYIVSSIYGFFKFKDMLILNFPGNKGGVCLFGGSLSYPSVYFCDEYTVSEDERIDKEQYGLTTGSIESLLKFRIVLSRF